MIIYQYNSITDDILKELSTEKTRLLLQTVIDFMNEGKPQPEFISFIERVETESVFKDDKEKESLTQHLKPVGKEKIMMLCLAIKYKGEDVISLKEYFCLEPAVFQRRKRERLYVRHYIPEAIYEHMIKSLILSLIQGGIIYNIIAEKSSKTESEIIMQDNNKPGIIIPLVPDKTVN